MSSDTREAPNLSRLIFQKADQQPTCDNAIGDDLRAWDKTAELGKPTFDSIPTGKLLQTGRSCKQKTCHIMVEFEYDFNKSPYANLPPFLEVSAINSETSDIQNS